MSLNSVSRDYRQGDETVHALRSTNLQLRAGELVGILGPSGSGKSTLLTVMGGLRTPSSGTVTISGEPFSALPEPFNRVVPPLLTAGAFGEIETRETKRGYATQPVIAWLDDPVEMARWVHAQAGDRLLLILSHRRDAMMAQYAKIKHIAATTGIRRFGVLFVDVEQVARGRENFLNLAGCARRFLSVQLDVVVGSCHDETGLRTWSGLSLAELAQFQWSSWSGAGMPALEENGFSGGVAH